MGFLAIVQAVIAVAGVVGGVLGLLGKKKAQAQVEAVTRHATELEGYAKTTERALDTVIGVVKQVGAVAVARGVKEARAKDPEGGQVIKNRVTLTGMNAF